LRFAEFQLLTAVKTVEARWRICLLAFPANNHFFGFERGIFRLNRQILESLVCVNFFGFLLHIFDYKSENEYLIKRIA